MWVAFPVRESKTVTTNDAAHPQTNPNPNTTRVVAAQLAEVVVSYQPATIKALEGSLGGEGRLECPPEYPSSLRCSCARDTWGVEYPLGKLFGGPVSARN